MTIKPSVKNFFIITLIAVLGILLLKFTVNKVKFVPNGIKSTVSAV